MTRLLIENGADLKVKDELVKKTPLERACIKKEVAILEMIIEKMLQFHKQDLLNEIVKVKLPAALSVRYVKMLLEMQVKLNIEYLDLGNLDRQNQRDEIRRYYNRNNLHNADRIRERREMRQRYMRENRFDREYMTDEADIEDYLEEMEMNYHEENRDDWQNVDRNRDRRVLRFQEKKENINHESNYALETSHKKVLWWSCKFGHKEIVDYLLKQQEGVDVNEQDQLSGETALIKAYMNKHTQIAEMLIDYGADFNLKDLLGHDCFFYFNKNNSKVLESQQSSLRDFYLVLKTSSPYELRRKTIHSFFSSKRKEGDFILRRIYSVNLEHIDFDKLINETQNNSSMNSCFLSYFIGMEFNDKIICDVINVLKDVKYFLENYTESSLVSLFKEYPLDLKQISDDDLSDMTARERVVNSINSKLNLINEFMLTVESKKNLLLKLPNLIFEQNELNTIVHPLNEIDTELDFYFEKQLLDEAFSDKGFRIKQLRNDGNSCIRALSDEFYGIDSSIYLKLISSKISEHLKKEIFCEHLRKTEEEGQFTSNEILIAFSTIYDCNINIHRLDKELVSINVKEKTQLTRVINILYHRGYYACLIKKVF